MLARCGSVHTYGMRYPLDLAFVSPEGLVLKACRGVGAREVHADAGAACVLERPASEGPWPDVGEHLWVRSVSVGMARRP